MDKSVPNQINIALAGNPNTGKSTVFNALTKLKQHTGNWAGKTVDKSVGYFSHNNINYEIVDLPGTYSLLTKSEEEAVARDYICSKTDGITIVVLDATALQRNLNLALQIMEFKNNVILCVNLLDEAKKKGISIDLNKMSQILGVPVIGTSARNGIGIDDLKNRIDKFIKNDEKNNHFDITYSDKFEQNIQNIQNQLKGNFPYEKFKRWVSIKILLGEQSAIDKLNALEYNINLNANPIDEKNIENVVETLMGISRNVINQTVKKSINYASIKERKIDSILTSKLFGIPIMIALLSLVFWITIIGANTPSSMLAGLFDKFETPLMNTLTYIHTPTMLKELLVYGFFRTLGWVISVMLPPMAIFFPLFSILEDWGYLPRIAFNLDGFFKKVGSSGKQSLTMIMGFGCNAAAIASSKILNSKKERLAAILTNNFIPCNGRFPTIILVSMLFIGGIFPFAKSLSAALVVAFAIILQFLITGLATKFLTKTSLKGIPSTLTLELPPYRKPQFFRLIVRATIDKTIKILIRAIKVAAPAGIIIWFLANINIGNISILAHIIKFLDPVGHMMGMDGTILMGFILGMPANEIVMPIIMMGYMNQGALLELSSLSAIGDLFISNGWTITTALCVILFSLNHFPCGTTLYSIYKETNSKKWTAVAFILPTVVGIIITTFVNQISRIFF